MEDNERIKNTLRDQKLEKETLDIQEISCGELPDPILYRRLEDVDEVRVLRSCARPETRRFIYINPAVYSQFSGIGVFAFLDQFLKLWPTIRKSALPYIGIPAVTAGSVGFGIGVHSVYHPNDEHTNCFKRTWFSALEGAGIVFPFLLGEEIEVYCSYPNHLDASKNCMVSEATFWKNFFPAPAVLGLGYMIWKMVPLFNKVAWMSRSKSHRFLVIAVDSLADMLFYSRIFQTLMTNISQIPQPLAYELGAIPAGAIVLIGQTLMPRHKQKFRTAITFGMTINLMFYLANFLKIEFMLPPETEEGPYLWSPLLKTIGFSLLFGAGIAVTIWRSRQSVIEQRNKEALFKSPGPESLLKQYLKEVVIGNPNARQQLVQILLEDLKNRKESIGFLLEDETIREVVLHDDTCRASIQQAFCLEEAETFPQTELIPVSPERFSPSIYNDEENQNDEVGSPAKETERFLVESNIITPRRQATSPYSITPRTQTTLRSSSSSPPAPPAIVRAFDAFKAASSSREQRSTKKDKCTIS